MIKSLGVVYMGKVASLTDSEAFVKITDGNRIYYGGDQAWYSAKIGKKGGCGPTAAANMTAYLSKHKPEFSKLYKYDISNITRDDFLKHMEEIYEFVTPWYIPFVNQPLGVPWLRKFTYGVVKFAADRGVNIRAHEASKPLTFENAVEYIIKGLNEDSPVGLLMLQNSNYPDYDFHWMTITSLHEDTSTGKVLVEVSTWGSMETLDFKKVWDNRDILKYRALVYFE